MSQKDCLAKFVSKINTHEIFGISDQYREEGQSETEAMLSAVAEKIESLKVDRTKVYAAVRLAYSNDGGEMPVEQGTIGMKLATGQVVLTTSGRETSPFPKFKGSTGKMTAAHERAVAAWLLQNALDEARSRGDNFNARTFESDLTSKTIPPASKDSAEEYLFGQQPAVVKSILKPLISKSDAATDAGFKHLERDHTWVKSFDITPNKREQFNIREFGQIDNRSYKVTKSTTFPGTQITGAPSQEIGTFKSLEAAVAQVDTLRPSEPAAPAESAEEIQAKADLMAALGDLGDLLSKGGKSFMMPEQEQKLLPILTRLFDAAFRLGYSKFKDASKYVLDTITKALGKDFADDITLNHLQGAYITMSGSRPEAEGIMGAVAVTSKADIEKHTAKNDNPAKDTNHVPSTSDSVERDSAAGSSEPAVGETVSPGRRGTGAGTEATAGQDGAGRGGQHSDSGVLSGRSTTSGKRSDHGLADGDSTGATAELAARTDDSERGSNVGDDGIPLESIPASAVSAAAKTPTAVLKDKLAQRAAPSKVVLGDADNIRETLPALLEGQQEDVKKAEDRFAKPNGYGMLFTNGTGTGKTFLGLGIVKRFALQGKENTLIIVPDEKIMTDWVKSAKILGLNITPLDDTKDAGKGIVITTYANAGANDQLSSRDWDLVIPDESHKLMQSADGTSTAALDNLRAITHHPDGAFQLYQMRNRDDIERVIYLKNEITATSKLMNRDDTMDVMRASYAKEIKKWEDELNPLSNKLDESRKAIKQEVADKQGEKRTRVTFLSATPFAYEKTLDWANGYLFDYKDGYPYTETSLAYNQPNPKQHFMMSHLGYSMRYNKLNSPDKNKIDTGMLQRALNGWMQKQGSVASRMLDVKPDYDRRFVLVDSAIGTKIDEALEWLDDQAREATSANTEARKSEKWDKEDDNGASQLRSIIYDQFDYLSRRYVLEAIKAREAIPIVKKHLELGRKVVVFHDYKKGGGINPFDIGPMGAASQIISPDETVKHNKKRENFNRVLAEFRQKFPELIEGLNELKSPIEQFSADIPDVMLINGDEKKKDLLKRYGDFQDDAVGPRVMLVQSAKNAGWSGHDTTGKNQRVLINLGQPTAPTTAIQQEGRIYRTGQYSNAIMRYLNTGTKWEMWAFATTIAERASAAENLGMGEQARALKDSFIQAFDESDSYPPGHEGEGTGGKERDKASNNAVTEWDRAKTNYWAQQKKNSKTKAQEGTDYYATPEPIGLKMAQWLDAKGGESTLEPSAGHGAIARWLPEITSRTAIEPSLSLRARLAMVMDPGKDKLIAGTFEEHHITNKYSGIAMNPPFGSGGRTAIDHLAKAATHLRDGGRIVALIPTGPAADAKWDKWFHGTEEKAVKPLVMHPTFKNIYKGDTVTARSTYIPNADTGVVVESMRDGVLQTKVLSGGRSYLTSITPESITGVKPTGPRTTTYSPAGDMHMIASIELPGHAFERAGTSVMTRIVVIEKQSDKAISQNMQAGRQIDLTGTKDINELFDRLEDMGMPERKLSAEQQAEQEAEQKLEEANQAKAEKAEAPKSEKPAKPGKPAKAASLQVGDTVDLDGGSYTVEIYKTAGGKEKAGVFVPSKEFAMKYSQLPFKVGAKGWFVGDFWLNKAGITASGSADDTKLSVTDVASQKEEAYSPPNGLNAGTQRHADLAKDLAGRINAKRPAGSDIRVLHAHSERVEGNERLSRSLAATQTIAKSLFGHEVVFVSFEGKPLFNGAMSLNIPGTVFINVDAKHPHMAVLGHELLHTLRATNPDIYSTLDKSLTALMSEEGGSAFLDKLEKQYMAQGMKMPFNWDEELWADVVGDNFMDPQFWSAIAEQQPTMFQRIANAITKFLDNVIEQASGSRPFGTDKMLTDVRLARAAVVKAMREYSGTQVGAVATDSPESDVKFSIVGQTKRQYTPAQLRAMENVGFKTDDKTLKARVKELWQDAGKKLAQGLVDQFAPIEDLDKEAYGLMRLSKGASGAFESLLHGGLLKLTDKVYDYDDKNKGGVLDKLLIPLQGEHHDFFRWVAANRAERLAGAGKENLFTAQDIADLKSLSQGIAESDFTLQHGANAGQVTRDRTLIYADSLKTFNAFNKNVMDMAEQSDLIDPVARQIWEHEFYVPFYRVSDEEGGSVRGMNVKGGVVRQEAFKTLKGGKNALNSDLLDNTLMNWAHLLDAAAKNRAALASITAAKNLGIAAPAPAGSKKSVWVMEQGEKKHYAISDPFVMTAISSLEYAGMNNPVMNAMSFMKHALTVGVTASPFFKIRNLIRDSVQAIAVSGLSYNPGKNLVDGWKLTNPQADSHFRMLAGGGTIHFGTMYEGSEAKRVQALIESGVESSTILRDAGLVKAFYRKVVEPTITAYNELGNRGEEINRSALYDQLRKQGVGHAEASLQARDLMDFSMQGTFATVRFLTQVVPFMNARMQGLYKLGRGGKEDPAKFAVVLGAVAAISLALLAAYHDDDDWKKREDWDRNNFWWFKVGGKAFRIPKPFEIGAIATLAERGFELAFDKEMNSKRFMSQVTALVGDNLSMNPVPQLFKPMLDIYSNINSFTGAPIESMSMERLKPEYRFNGRTSMFARGASAGLNAASNVVGLNSLSPVQIDHLVRGYFGWLGGFIVGAGDLIARPATNQTTNATPDFWKAATGSIVSDLKDSPSRYVSEMYKQAHEIEQAYGTWRQLKKEGKNKEAAQFVVDHRSELKQYSSLEAIKKEEATLNERIRVIERSNMDPDQKRDLIRAVQVRRDTVARHASH